MYIRALTAFLLPVVLVSTLSCEALDLCGDPVDRTVEEPEEKIVEKSIDIPYEFWQDNLINRGVWSDPVYRFIWISKNCKTLILPDSALLQEAYPTPEVSEPLVVDPVVPEDVREIVEASTSPMLSQESVEDRAEPVIDYNGINVLLYKTVGCAPCAKMSEEIRNNYTGEFSEYIMISGSVTRGGRTIRVYPTTEILKDNKSIFVIEGYMPWSKLKVYIDKAAK